MINISEEQLNKGLMAIMSAVAILPKSDIVTNLVEFYHELNAEKLKEFEIEVQQYDDGLLLMDCLLDPQITIPGNPANIQLAEN